MPVPIRLTFDATTDVAYLELQPTGPVDVLGPALLIETDRAFAGHIIADFTLADGRLVGFELQHASACLPADLLMAAELALGSTTARAIFEALQVVLGGATALLGLRAARSWAGVLAAGLATYLVVLFAGYWASLDYLAAVAPILCWELDDLAGFGPRRALLPGDPVGRLEAWLDQRWPIRPVAIV